MKKRVTKKRPIVVAIILFVILILLFSFMFFLSPKEIATTKAISAIANVVITIYAKSITVLSP